MPTWKGIWEEKMLPPGDKAGGGGWLGLRGSLSVIVGSLTGTPTSHSLLVGGSGFAAEPDLSRN
jgi:hypothetical protein